MAKFYKSLGGVVTYTLCMCLAFSVLSYSFYCLFSSDDDGEQNIVSTPSSVIGSKNATSNAVDEITNGETGKVVSPMNVKRKSLDTIDDVLDEELSNTLNAMTLRDADIAPSEDDNIVIYAADEILNTDDEFITTEDVLDDPICDENTSSTTPTIGAASNEACIPAHGENYFEVTPEYIDAVDPSTPREPIYIRDKVRAGDSAGKILNTWLSPAEIHNLLATANKLYKLSNIRVGRSYVVTLDPYDKSFQNFSYEIDNAKVLSVSLDKTNSIKSLDQAAKEKHFVADITGILYDYKLVLVQGEVENSLYGAVINTGETIALGALLTDIFGWEVDFANDIRHGDTFTALVEKRYREGKFKGYGRVLYATYVNDDNVYEAFRFSDENGGSAYFDRKGNSLRKAFLKAPLNFTRISSPYTMKRYHPILKRNRPHQGIDYAAPTGTPVKTVGDGFVAYRGWMNGYGNIVRIRHANRIETMYAHLSRFAKNLKKGQRVRQGQVIAYVGSTGLSTGPHLDFRVRKNGQFVNPNTLLNPRSNPVPKKLKGEFATRIKLYEDLQRDIGVKSYVPELVVDN